MLVLGSVKECDANWPSRMGQSSHPSRIQFKPPCFGHWGGFPLLQGFLVWCFGGYNLPRYAMIENEARHVNCGT